MTRLNLELVELRQALRDLALDCVADLETDGEDAVVVSVANINRLCRLAGFSGVDAVTQILDAEPPDKPSRSTS